jgi:hypothetical protein
VQARATQVIASRNSPTPDDTQVPWTICQSNDCIRLKIPCLACAKRIASVEGRGHSSQPRPQQLQQQQNGSQQNGPQQSHSQQHSNGQQHANGPQQHSNGLQQRNKQPQHRQQKQNGSQHSRGHSNGCRKNFSKWCAKGRQNLGPIGSGIHASRQAGGRNSGKSVGNGIGGAAGIGEIRTAFPTA